jgi:hypothetical protein
MRTARLCPAHNPILTRGRPPAGSAACTHRPVGQHPTDRGRWPIAGLRWIEFHAEPRTADLPGAPEQLPEPALSIWSHNGLLASVFSALGTDETLHNTFVVQRKCCAGLHRRQGQHGPIRGLQASESTPLRPGLRGVTSSSGSASAAHVSLALALIRRTRKDLRLPPTALHRVQQGWRDSTG